MLRYRYTRYYQVRSLLEELHNTSRTKKIFFLAKCKKGETEGQAHGLDTLKSIFAK